MHYSPQSRHGAPFLKCTPACPPPRLAPESNSPAPARVVASSRRSLLERVGILPPGAAANLCVRASVCACLSGHACMQERACGRKRVAIATACWRVLCGIRDLHTARRKRYVVHRVGAVRHCVLRSGRSRGLTRSCRCSTPHRSSSTSSASSRPAPAGQVGSPLRTPAPRLGSPLPARYTPGLGSPLAKSAPGLGVPLTRAHLPSSTTACVLGCANTCAHRRSGAFQQCGGGLLQ